MLLTIFLVLSHLPLHVLSEHLFMVYVTVPQKEGRNEREDIGFINDILTETAGITVHVARKFLDNQNIILVLEIQELCQWSSLTSALSERGYRLSVSPLQHCSEYAEELNVSITYTPSSDLQAYDVINIFDVVYHDLGLTTDEYRDQMRKHFERAKAVLGEGTDGTCYRITGDLPVKFLYFDSGFNAKQIDGIYEKLRQDSKANVEVTALQSLRSYTQTC